MSTSVSVLVTDDQQLIRDGIASLLELQDGITVVGTAANGRECIDAAARLCPDVILMDIRMPVMDGIEATAKLHDAGATARILVLTTFDDEEYVVKALRAGAVGYLLKDLPIDDLARAIVQTAGGTTQIASAALAALLRSPNGATNKLMRPDADLRPIWEGLSTREREVLHLVGEGATNREIAAQLHLSEGTVKNYISNLLATFDFRDRVEAALTVVRNGWS